MANLPQTALPPEITEFDEFLRQVAESAQALSGGTGSAIAIRGGNDRDGEEVFCVARSGITAPPLGSRLDANAGISGECLLSEMVLHCYDTAADPRVDPEVCREMGLRSIVVLPVRGRNRASGILEVFSDQPNAFTGEHIASLKRLTEMVEMACASATVSGEASNIESHITSPQHAAQTAISGNARLPFPLSFLKDKRSYWIAGAGLAILLAFTSVGLKALFSSSGRSSAKQTSQPSVTPSAPESAEIQFQAPAGDAHKRHSTNSGDERRGLQKASQVEMLTGKDNARRIAGSPKATSEAEGSDRELDTPAPALPLVANASPPENVLVTTSSLPKLSPVVSQGVSGGTLDRRVNPIYPPEALAMKLEGEVVLAATITKTGQVRDLKLLSGSPILGRAAIDAVKQWHYQPYRLNNEPLESQTQITVRFRAP